MNGYLNRKRNEMDKAFHAGWRDAFETFSKQWRRKPDSLSKEELIACTDHLLLLVHPDTENLTEGEITAHVR
jgi:hypothetical protein